jgi:hypothetical protein
VSEAAGSIAKMERLVVAVISRTGGGVDPLIYAKEMLLEC